MIVAGCDVGSTTGKLVIMQDNKIIGSSIVPSSAVSEKTSDTAMEEALKQCSIKREDIQFCVGTGYGRNVIPFANKNVSEISCHGLGAFWADPKIRTVVDIGGQDCKVIKINDAGKVEDFVMNDKCAAGTGRFLMDICDSIGLKVEELGPLSLEATEMYSVSAGCSVFATSEVVVLKNQNKSIEGIAASLNDAVARRLIGLVKKVGLEPEFIVSGGVSKNIGVVTFLEKHLERKILPIQYDPQLLGAVGAAVFAQKALEKKAKKPNLEN